MGYEIELKAWVDDWAAVEAVLRERCTLVGEVRKSDRYFVSGVEGERDTAFRLREAAGQSVVTFKEKTVRDGIETNLEREFGVDDGVAFLELVERVGCLPLYNKTKVGLEFRHENMTIELATVEGVGDFLEIEIVELSDDPGLHRRAAQTVRAFLGEVGISETKIEDRSYLQLVGRHDVRKDCSGT